MKTRNETELSIRVQKNITAEPVENSGHYALGRENTNSVEQDLGLQARFAKGKSIEDWKIGRLED